MVSAMRTNVSDLGTILGVWAHPDDEAFLSAGLMLAAVANRQRVVCLTLTAGERGGSEHDDIEAVARARRLELARALEIAGVREHIVHDLPDGGCADVDPALGVSLIRSQIDRVTPDTIVTFGPDGLTGHPDHRAVSGWTTRAWEATGQRASLLYVTTPTGFNSRHRFIHDAIHPFDPQLPIETPVEDLTVRLRLTRAQLRQKMAVLRAHRSQIAPIESIVGTDALTRWWAEECFIAATPVDRSIVASRRISRRDVENNGSVPTLG
jgi:LmbE family N-acetylglucosaminyl deacetylase